MIAWLERVGDLLARDARADREARSQRLRKRHDVGRDVVVLECEPLPRASESGLHFVDDQRRAALVAELSSSRQELRRREPNAAFSLHHLEQDRGRVVSDRLVQRLLVVQ